MLSRTFFLGFAATLAMTGVALAADLPSRVQAPAPYIAPVPVFTWSGFYLGLNAGWVGSAQNTITNIGTDTGAGGLGTALVTGAIPTSLSLADSGIIGGGQIGYNWQAGSWVFGAEADFDGSSAKNSVLIGPITVPGYVPQSSQFSRALDWLATFRGRLGFTVTPALLVYGTGGFALGQTRIGNQFICPGCIPPASTEASTTNQTTSTSGGWTLGAGVEWKIAPRWSLKAEYLYVDLGSHSSQISYAYAGNASTLTSSVRDSYNIARIGVNYQF